MCETQGPFKRFLEKIQLLPEKQIWPLGIYLEYKTISIRSTVIWDLEC